MSQTNSDVRQAFSNAFTTHFGGYIEYDSNGNIISMDKDYQGSPTQKRLLRKELSNIRIQGMKLKEKGAGPTQVQTYYFNELAALRALPELDME